MRPWARRLLTIPLYVALLGISLLSMPVWLPGAALVDLARGTPWGAVRSLVFFTLYLGCEVGGIVLALGLALAGALPGVSAADMAKHYFRLQRAWASALLRSGERILGFRVEVAGDDGVGAGPMLVFTRHASVADTVLPAVFLSGRHHLRLRYVMKRELLWDPCLDLVGHRLPNYFVDRASKESAQEIEGIRQLAQNLGAGEGVLIFPEGTRFSEAKRARVLERLARSAPELVERAESLSHVLPPRLGGPLALLETSPGSDAVFCAHAGFDGVTRFSEFFRGDLVGRVVRVLFWRIPAAEIPTDREGRVDWLFTQWKRVDAWVGGQREARAAAEAA